jgi:hypothetical protein
MMPTTLISMMRLDEKKYMMNSRGFFVPYAVMRALMPNAKKNNDKKAMTIFFTHHTREPMKPLPHSNRKKFSCYG